MGVCENHISSGSLRYQIASSPCIRRMWREVQHIPCGCPTLTHPEPVEKMAEIGHSILDKLEVSQDKRRYAVTHLPG